MPKNIQKSLQDYLSKIKSPRSQIHLPSRKWILRGCKHPRTPSFAIDDKKNRAQGEGSSNKNKDDEATLEDVDQFLFENFKSLYLKDDEETENNNNNSHKTHKGLHNTKRVDSVEESRGKGLKLGPTSFDSSEEQPPLDLRGSNRFFMTRGFSGPTGDEAGSSSESGSTLNESSIKEGNNGTERLPDKCVVVLANSPSPYEDFKRSMQGMVEARMRKNERVDWDFMQELLFCYINMNEKKSYKFILSAFVDLITLMRRPPQTAPVKVKPRSVRTVRIGREVRKKTKEVTLEFGSS